MRTIPEDYAAIEDSSPYREAQKIALSVVRDMSSGEYWHFLDSQEMRLLEKATSANIAFNLDAAISEYRIQIGVEGYVRQAESLMQTIRRVLWSKPPLPLRGTAGRPDEKKLRMHLPSERQQEILERLEPELLRAVIQAAFAREYRTLMRVYKNNESGRIEVLSSLQKQYTESMESIVR